MNAKLLSPPGGRQAAIAVTVRLAVMGILGIRLRTPVSPGTRTPLRAPAKPAPMKVPTPLAENAQVGLCVNNNRQETHKWPLTYLIGNFLIHSLHFG